MQNQSLTTFESEHGSFGTRRSGISAIGPKRVGGNFGYPSRATRTPTSSECSLPTTDMNEVIPKTGMSP
jgi:hypothetical protein